MGLIYQPDMPRVYVPQDPCQEPRMVANAQAPVKRPRVLRALMHACELLCARRPGRRLSKDSAVERVCVSRCSHAHLRRANGKGAQVVAAEVSQIDGHRRGEVGGSE